MAFDSNALVTLFTELSALNVGEDAKDHYFVRYCNRPIRYGDDVVATCGLYAGSDDEVEVATVTIDCKVFTSEELYKYAWDCKRKFAAPLPTTGFNWPGINTSDGREFVFHHMHNHNRDKPEVGYLIQMGSDNVQALDMLEALGQMVVSLHKQPVIICRAYATSFVDVLATFFPKHPQIPYVAPTKK